MTIIGVVLFLVVLALVIYGIDFLPGNPTLKRAAQGVLIILAALWLAEQFGLFGPFPLATPNRVVTPRPR